MRTISTIVLMLCLLGMGRGTANAQDMDFALTELAAGHNNEIRTTLSKQGHWLKWSQSSWAGTGQKVFAVLEMYSDWDRDTSTGEISILAEVNAIQVRLTVSGTPGAVLAELSIEPQQPGDAPRAYSFEIDEIDYQ